MSFKLFSGNSGTISISSLCLLCSWQGGNDTTSSHGDDVQFIKEEEKAQQRGTKRARSPEKEEKRRLVCPILLYL